MKATMQVRHLLQLVLSFDLNQIIYKKMRHYVFSDVVPFRIIQLIITGRSSKTADGN